MNLVIITQLTRVFRSFRSSEKENEEDDDFSPEIADIEEENIGDIRK